MNAAVVRAIARITVFGAQRNTLLFTGHRR
jgi:hypothetical protein